MNPFTEKHIVNYFKEKKQLLVTQDLNNIKTVHRFTDPKEAISKISVMAGLKTIFFNK